MICNFQNLNIDSLQPKNIKLIFYYIIGIILAGKSLPRFTRKVLPLLLMLLRSITHCGLERKQNYQIKETWHQLFNIQIIQFKFSQNFTNHLQKEENCHTLIGQHNMKIFILIEDYRRSTRKSYDGNTLEYKLYHQEVIHFYLKSFY